MKTSKPPGPKTLGQAEFRRTVVREKLEQAGKESAKTKDRTVKQLIDLLSTALTGLKIATASDVKRLERKLSRISTRLRVLEKTQRKTPENS